MRSIQILLDPEQYKGCPELTAFAALDQETKNDIFVKLGLCS
jgi:hypothetical protein